MKTTLEIQNLKCDGCEATIYNKLPEINNVKDLIIDVGSSTVSFDYSSSFDLETVKEVLVAIGYPVQGEANKFITRAKSYISCATGRISK